MNYKYWLVWWIGYVCLIVAAEFLPRIMSEEVRREIPWPLRLAITGALSGVGSAILISLGRNSA